MSGVEHPDGNVIWMEDKALGRLMFQGHISFQKVAQLDLDAFDRAVISQPINSAADLFQTLEILFRRAAEQDGQNGVSSHSHAEREG